MNLYFQDESRFGLMTHLGSCITAKGVRPVISYHHRFSNTYLFGSYSPLDGSSFVWEINGVEKEIFHQYLTTLSQYRPREYKVVVIDNAGFHSVKGIKIPKNIYLLNMPPCSPEFNPREQVWVHIQKRYENQTFNSMKELKDWFHKAVLEMTPKIIMSITSNHHYIDGFYAAFNN